MRGQSQRLAFLAASGATLLVYWFSLPPHLAQGMSGAYATGAAYAGVSHPMGDPAWTIYAWLLTHLIPVGNLAWRVSLASAIAAAIACGLVARLVAGSGDWLLDGYTRFTRLPPAEDSWLRTVAGAVAGVALGVTPEFWRKALTPDPHTFGSMLFCLTLACLGRWFPNPARKRWLLAAIISYGVLLVSLPHLFSAAFGLVFIVLMGDCALGRDLFGFSAVILLFGAGWELLGSVPPLLSNLTQSYAMWGVYLFVGITAGFIVAGATIYTRQIGSEWQCSTMCLLALFSCLSLYLFLPISSMTNPPMNWGYAREVEGFLHLIGRGQYEQIYPGSDFWNSGEQMAKFGPRIILAFGIIFLIPAGFPIILIRRSEGLARRWIAGLLLLAVTMLLLLLGCLNPPLDAGHQDSLLPFFTGFHALLAIFSGYGLLIVGTVLGRPGAARLEGRQRS